MKKYNLGLDLGTNSVGWALVDDEGKVIRKNGKSLWGVRMFNEASDASDRRLARGNRRRINRRNYRIKLLRGLFNDEIRNVDSSFFERLDDSFYKAIDKHNPKAIHLFMDKDYTDINYYQDYPTIYHLRKMLIESNKKEDIRFIYLAIHHIIKYRGNFLYPGEFDAHDSKIVLDFFNNLNNVLLDTMAEYEDDEEFFQRLDVNEDFIKKFDEIMVKKLSKNDKKDLLKKLFKTDKKTFVTEAIIPLLTGGNINLSSLSLIKEEKYPKSELCCLSEAFPEQLDNALTNIKELNGLLSYLINIKDVIDHYYVVDLLGTNKSISEAMVNKYNIHQQELKELKALIKEYLPNEYNDCFKNVNTLNNYPHYIGMNNSNGAMKRFGHCKREDFYKYIKGLLLKITNKKASKQIEDILFKMESNNYLLRQNSDQNGSIPMQLHLSELKAILNNQAKFYPFLNSISDDITIKDKIISIFKFKIPYYVGPLNEHSKFSWIKKNSDDKIYPWNFDKVVNKEDTAEAFITRMTNKCTYLKAEECLPKNSILFSYYNCLTYLNKLNINNSPIKPIDKDLIIKEVFLKVKKPTRKQLANFVKKAFGESTVITTSNNKELEEINCDMSSYITFKNIFKESFKDNLEMIEDIIRDIVIFEDKSILAYRLENKYKLSENIIKEIKNLNYTGYGRLSRKFLNGLEIINKETGEANTFIEIMRNTNLNLQQILYDVNLNYKDIIDNENRRSLTDIEEISVNDFIEDNLYVSPIMKRTLIQAYGIIEELEHITNHKIDKYYVECTRENKDEKKRSVSRYDKLKEIYKSSKDFAGKFNIDIKALNSKLDEYKDSLKSDLIYLYFTQLGKDMYTLENIDFSKLLNNTYYDIDHIYPQALIKDDSFSNRVLTKKSKNAAKLDHFIFEIDNFLNKDAYAFYDLLVTKGLITKEKYRRLTKHEMSIDELNGFVNRQLVATNQSVKGLIDLLKLYKGVKPEDIIYSKAEVVSDFRKEFDVLKSRLANNFHHAHDAYLNAVVGGAIDKYYKYCHFFSIKDYSRLREKNITINTNNILKKNREFNGNIIWNKDIMIPRIKNIIYNQYDIMETTRCYNSNLLYDKVTVYPSIDNKEAKDHGNIPVSFKDARLDASKYGGYKSYSFSQYALLELKDKSFNNYVIMEPIPKAFADDIKAYLDQCGFKDYKIVISNLKINTVFVENKLKYCVTGKSGSAYVVKNLNDRYFNYEIIKIIKKIEKFINNESNKVNMTINEDYCVISPARSKYNKEVILSMEEVKSLYKELINLYNKDVYAYSPIRKIYDAMVECEALSLIDSIHLCYQLLSLLQTNSRSLADLTLIGLSKNSGTITISKKLKPGVKIITQSITGYYEKILYEVK